MANIGWISIHRKIRDCVIWDTNEPFTRRDAWIDLLLLANHNDKDIIFDGKKITIKKGQYLTSVRKLAQEWHWGNAKTLAYLRLLEQCEMITRHADSRRTLITIVNYGIYQDENLDQRNTNGTVTDTVAERRPTTNNNYNNENNENNKKDRAKPVRHKYGQYKNVLLSDQDMEKLKTEFPNDYQERIERVSEYCKSSGKSYSDYLATIRSWARKENKNNGHISTGHITADEEEQRNREIREYLASDEYRDNDERPFA